MGKFNPGQSKPAGSGRKKGVPNKRTQDLREALEGSGLDIPSRIIALLPALAPLEQAGILVDLLPYLYPKHRAIEVTASGECPRCVSRDNLQHMSEVEARAEAIRLLKEVAIDDVLRMDATV